MLKTEVLQLVTLYSNLSKWGCETRGVFYTVQDEATEAELDNSRGETYFLIGSTP